MKPLHKLKDMPRTILWDQPTPLERLPNLARHLGADNIWVKRDDCNGLAFGGNKVRQMEYYLGDAIDRDADTLLITGAVQSNFVRTAAASCARLGLACHVQLEERVSKNTPAYKTSGNVLLDKLLGATIHHYSEGEDEEGADRNLETIADQLRSDGKSPYVVHLHPSHPPFGALGYIDAASELVDQTGQLKLQPDAIITPSGSGNTQAGLVYGLKSLGCNIPVIGACVRRDADSQEPRLVERLAQIGDLLEENPTATAQDINLTDAFLAPGYGEAGTETLEAISLAARLEALILDPVYTGKAFAALVAHARENPNSNLVIVHTGGGPSIFGYADNMLIPKGGLINPS